MKWTRVTIHPRLHNNSLIPKLLRGEGVVQETRERIMPAALRESMTQLAGGDLAGRVPGHLFNRYFLSTCSMPGTSLGSKDTMLNKTKFLLSWNLLLSLGDR